MSYRLLVAPSALKQLQRLEPHLRSRVDATILRLAGQPRPPGCLKLHGEEPDGYRIRVSDVRILYRIIDRQELVEVYRIKWRDKAYK